MLKLPPEQQKYVVQKLYDGYYAFECLTEREWDEAYVECVLYLRVLMETAKTALGHSKDRVKKRTKWHNESLLSASMVSQQQ